MKALNKYFGWQLAGALAFFFLALAGVVWLTQSLKFVELIINKGLTAGHFFYLSLLLLPWVITLVLPIAVFAAVLYTYNRLNNEREIVVIWSAGVSTWAIARPALVLAVLTTLLSYCFTLYLMPAGYREFKDLKTSLRSSVSYILLQEGTFNSIGDSLTIYVRARRANGEMLGILVHDSRKRLRPVTMMAQSGALVRTADGPRFVLVNGNRQEVDQQTNQLSMLYFDRYALDLTQFVHEEADRWLEAKERFLGELWYPTDSINDQRNALRLRAEAHDRLSAPLYCLAFVLIALAAVLSGDYNRRGNQWRIGAALGAIVLVRLVGLGFVNMTANVGWSAPLIYINVFAAIVLALLVLGGRLSLNHWSFSGWRLLKRRMAPS